MSAERVEVTIVEHPRGGYALRGFGGTHNWVCGVSRKLATFTRDAKNALCFQTIGDAVAAVSFCNNLIWQNDCS